MHRITKLALSLALTLSAAATFAATFTWTAAGDILTFDVHSQNETQNIAANNAVYEALVRRDPEMKIQPALAESWERVPEGFLFHLRKGVRFHEGEEFTADDVVFSISRALSPRSQFKSSTTGILGAEKKGDYEVLLKTSTGSPVIINQLSQLLIMNRAWCEKHGALEVQDFINKEESYAARHANGTGPFRLKTREVDVRTVFERNTGWWDEANRVGNVDEVVFMPIQSAATRTAALLSGQVDFVIDPAIQDLQRLRKTDGVKVVEGSELRVLMVSLDLGREEPINMTDGKGRKLTKNPFRDIRVRQALDCAINREGLVRGVMRGSAKPTGTIIAERVNGWTKELGEYTKFDLAKAKRLLAEAGYADGFSFTMDTPNNRWINDENITKALAGMWAKIGVKVTVNSMPRALFFPKVLSFDTSAALVGWGVSTMDGLYGLQSLSVTFDKASGNGVSNVGRASNAKIDELAAKIIAEEDVEKRNAYLREALAVEKAELLHLPLHEQVIPWAMRKNIDVVHRPDNRMTPDWVTVH